MGRLVVTEYLSLDGVMEAPGGGEDYVHAGWTFRVERGPDGVAFKLDETRRSGALLFGRVTYEGMAAVWPHMTGEVADLFNSLPKFVVSSTLDAATWNNTEVLRSDLVEEMERLKERFDDDIVVHGSAQLVQGLLLHDLVDELRLMVFPVMLGAGKRLVEHTDELKRFRLRSSSVVGEGIAILTYTPVYDYVVARDMPADVDTVWRAWTRPGDYAAWFNAVPGSVELDVRPGGAWRLELSSGDDGPPETMSGSYLEVVPGVRLVMSTAFAAGDTVMEMTFSPTGSGSRVEIRQVCDSRAACDGGREGSEILLDACAKYVADLGDGPRRELESRPVTTDRRWLQPGDEGFDARRAGFNIALEHHPATIVEAADPAEVQAAVQHAARAGHPVAVMNTGHGPSVPADGAVLIRTGRLDRVAVDPDRRTARLEGGATWGAVIDAAAPHGLAPLNGSSPHVGTVGYTLGGGVGPLGRRFGFAADHVRWLDVVTADGRLRHVTAESDPDLFWALRGAGANFGVVTAMEVDLFPVATLLGGELGFGGGASEDVLHAYAAWAAEVPEAMSSSVLLLTYPDDPAVPDDLRGRHITHVRIAYSGADLAEGWRWVATLRGLGSPVLDTVRVMPYAEVGTIHHEPVDEPVPAFDRNILLRDFDQDAAAVLAKHAGPTAGAPYLVEVRAWGGALARPAAVANAVTGRDAAYSLVAISEPEIEDRERRDQLLVAMERWATGTTYINFNGVEDSSVEAVRRAYTPDDLARLQQVKAVYDPDNLFRINFNIPPNDR
jgi:FAD/FMN-containing dehydrogenase/uncharacterized protein YndB with AHSA1/START domain/dihydrofolate reductase